MSPFDVHAYLLLPEECWGARALWPWQDEDLGYGCLWQKASFHSLLPEAVRKQKDRLHPGVENTAKTTSISS